MSRLALVLVVLALVVSSGSAFEDSSTTPSLTTLQPFSTVINETACLEERAFCESALAKKAMQTNVREASDRPGRPVCGTDNVTYVNDCSLKLAQCLGKDVSEAYTGRCKDHTPCWTYLQQTARAARGSRGSGSGRSVFVPTCKKDGSYAALQCHKETGLCWCVTPQGRRVSYSSFSGSRPNCKRAAKTRRGSSPRRRRQRRGCGRNGRSSFNNNLIEIFREEYRREMLALSPGSASWGDLGNVTDIKILDWKFDSLDLDGDKRLKRFESRDLRNFVKTSLKPKPCARSFARRCDMNRDRSISRHEWTACFGLDFEQTSLGAWRENATQPTRVSPPLTVRDKSVLQETRTDPLPGFPVDSLDRKEEPELTDCLSDRKAVIDEQSSSVSELYVPVCYPDGRYQKLQCYNSTGYCWCVHEDSGKVIPGTSVKDKKPKCDELAPTNRSMNGCPEPMKQEFLKHLMEFFKNRMQAAMNETDGYRSSDWQVSAEDRIATWNFLVLDKNKNKVLDRAEWKTFRSLVSTQTLLKRCGKKLPRYCDVNKDNSISITEWLECLRTPPQPRVVATTTTSNPRKRGPNPFESLLKAD